MCACACNYYNVIKINNAAPKSASEHQIHFYELLVCKKLRVLDTGIWNSYYTYYYYYIIRLQKQQTGNVFARCWSLYPFILDASLMLHTPKHKSIHVMSTYILSIRLNAQFVGCTWQLSCVAPNALIKSTRFY